MNYNVHCLILTLNKPIIQNKVCFSTYVSFVILHLDLSRVTEFDHRADRHLKLPPGLQVQPDKVALGRRIYLKMQLEKQDED